MPGMSGLELVARLETLYSRQLPVIFLTGLRRRNPLYEFQSESAAGPIRCCLYWVSVLAGIGEHRSYSADNDHEPFISLGIGTSGQPPK